MAACTSLLNSDLSERFEFITIDSTAPLIGKSSILSRTFRALGRIFRFIWLISTRRIRHVLVFSSAGLSFLEKGIMAIIGGTLGKNVLIAPRSGILEDDLRSSRSLRYFFRLVVRFSDYVICQSEHWKNLFLGLSDKERKYRIIHNWIHPDDYFFRNEPESQDEFRLLYIGQFHAYKGVYDLLDAIRILRGRRHNIILNVYGDGPEKEGILDFISENELEGSVSVPGWADMEIKRNAFATHHLLVVPSHSEGFPNIILEAMASGIPVAASSIESINSIIKTGKNGITFEPHHPESLANSIEQVLVDKEVLEDMKMRARETIENKYSIQIAVSRFHELLRA